MTFTFTYSNFIYLEKRLIFFLAALGIRFCMGFSIVAASRGYSLVAMCRLLIAVASLVAEHGL